MATFKEWASTHILIGQTEMYKGAAMAWHAGAASRDAEVAALNQIIAQQNDERQKIIGEAQRNDANRATIELAATERARQAEKEIIDLRAELTKLYGIFGDYDTTVNSWEVADAMWNGLRSKIEAARALVLRMHQAAALSCEEDGPEFSGLADELEAALGKQGERGGKR